MEWWVYRNGEVSNRPLTRREMREKDYVTRDTYVCRTGQDSWNQAKDDPELEAVLDDGEGPGNTENLELDGESTGPRATPAFNVDHTPSTTSGDDGESTDHSDRSPDPDHEVPSEASETSSDASEASFRSQSDIIAASLWKRPLAFLLDYGLFYLGIWILSGYYYREMAEIGSFGIVLGHSTFFLYMAVLNSDIGGSSSIGKKLTGLRVTDEEGFSLSFYTSFWRYFFLLLPMVLFSVVFTDLLGELPDVVHVALVMVGLFLAVSLVYLYLFNRYRRSLHDCITTTVVVEEPPRDILNFSFWRPHLYFIGVFFALSIYCLSVLFAHYGGIVPILSLQKSLLQHQKILATGIPVYRNFTTDVEGADRTLFVNVWADKPVMNPGRLKRMMIRKTFRQSILVDRYGAIELGIGTGFNAGIISGIRYRRDRRSVEDWREFLRAD